MSFQSELELARAHDADVWPPLWPDDDDNLQWVPFKRRCDDERCPWCWAQEFYEFVPRVRTDGVGNSEPANASDGERAD